MKKRNSFLILLVLIGLVVALPQTAHAWLSGWTYCREITLNSATTVADYQVKVELTSPNFNYSHAQTNGEDLRFTDGSDVLQDYWIEEWNTTGTSTVWVEVAASSTSSFYMYYGDSGASAATNGDNTFELFDDFPGSSIDTGKWAVNTTGVGTIGITDQKLTANIVSTVSGNNAAVGSVAQFSRPIIMEADVALAGLATNRHYPGIGFYGVPGTLVVRPSVACGRQWDSNSLFIHFGVAPSEGGEFIYTDKGDGSYHIKIVWTATKCELFLDNISEAVCTTVENIPDGSLKIGAGTHNHPTSTSGWVGDETFDNIYVRKYADPEPTSTVGVETLPVELSVFTAQFINNIPTLYWTTQSETDNLGWNVYRAKNDENLTNAKKVNYELIPGFGTTSEPHDYIYEDEIVDGMPDDMYWYWLQSIDLGGEVHYSNSAVLQIPPDDPSMPPDDPALEYGLYQNSPNPFNIGTRTEITFYLCESAFIEINVYNIRGEFVKCIYSGYEEFDANNPMAKTVDWDGKDENGKPQNSGMYFYQLKTENYNEVKKMLLIN